MSIIDIFVYVPFAVFALSFLSFVLRCRFGLAAKMMWTAWLLLSLSKFWGFRTFGGHAFYPDFPQWLIIVWDIAYSGAVALTILSLVFFFRFRFKALVLSLAAWSVALAGVWSGIAVPEVNEVRLEFAGLPDSLDGYRIAHISDLHCSNAARRWRTEAIVEKTNAIGADIICLTGDYVDGYVSDVGDDLHPITRLHARGGVYFVTGNHEYYRDQRKWEAWYRDNGINFLTNQCVFPHKDLAVGGVNDFASRRHGGIPPDVREAFAAATNGEFRVLLQHQPKEAKVNFREVGVDLQLSGHTHGGVAPVIRHFVSKHNSGYTRGAYRYGDSVLYVSPGAGQWAGFPSRFCNPSEITLITLVKGR